MLSVGLREHASCLTPASAQALLWLSVLACLHVCETTRPRERPHHTPALPHSRAPTPIRPHKTIGWGSFRYPKQRVACRVLKAYVQAGCCCCVFFLPRCILLLLL